MDNPACEKDPVAEDKKMPPSGPQTDPSSGALLTSPSSPAHDKLLGNPDSASLKRTGEPREAWANKAEFVLACIGYAVGLGNMWRFPYLCYKSGGGAFLVPYFIMLIVCGIPLLFMELAIGQYTRQGPVGAMERLSPIFKGAGLATVIISFLLATYYNVIIAWAMFYFGSSFTSPLPWDGCNNTWSTEDCWAISGGGARPNNSVPAPQEYYDHAVLQISSGLEEPGTIRWELLGCLVLAWVLVYFCLWKGKGRIERFQDLQGHFGLGIKSSGKVVYVTATLPYLLIIAFVVRAVTLEGADLGLRYFFYPKWELLLDAKVWVNAAAQNFNSIGIGFGSLIAFSSYNNFNNGLLRDTLVISLVDAFTCILAGVCVFAVLGNLAFEQGRTVDEVVTSGPGLVFVAYPQALAKMPLPQIWSVIFFGMLLCLGIDSQFATVEVIITSLKDAYGPWIHKYLKRHEVLVLAVCIISFICGFPCITQGGVYYFQLIDYYAAAVSLMYIAFFEVVGVVWVYGAGRLSNNVKDMTGALPPLYIRFCWWVAAPCLITAIWIFSWIDYEEPTYNNGAYSYPKWGIGLGWFLASLSLMSIPVLGIVAVFKAKGDTIFQKFMNSVRSTIKECPCCGEPLDETHSAHNEENLLRLTNLTQDNLHI